MGTNYLTSGIATFLAATEHPYPDVRNLAGVLTNVAQIAVGSYTGTGAEITVDTPGDPRVVLLVDETQTTTALHISGQDDAAYINLATGVKVTTNGVTLGSGGFTIGTDADINTDSDVGFYLAII